MGGRLNLGRYRLDEQVGQGGMAVVWRGFDTQLRRTVAVKVLHAHLHARQEIRRRFDREAHAVARLHHPFILDVYDFSAEPSYLVTEFIRGHTLRAFAEAHPFDPPELAAACLVPIAEALEHAHAKGVIHRDLKPENVMVRDDGVVKLTDFGIAALLDPDEKFTATGAILGSPAHLAPETIEGKPADARADLFSFGTILYWLSCGQLPYQAPSPAALLHNILEGKRQDPRMLRPSLSDGQARVIARCLENDPAARYQSASELHRDLLQLLAEAGIEDPVSVVAEFVKAPARTSAGVRQGLVARSLAQGDEHLRTRRTSAALASFGRALALEPGNAVAQGQVDRIRRREKVLRLGRRAAIAMAALVLAIGAFSQLHAAILRLRARKALAAAAALAAPARTGPPPRIDPPAAVAKEPDSRALPDRPAPPPAPARKLKRAQVARADVSRPRAGGARDPAGAASTAAEIPVALHSRFGGELMLDGKDLGDSQIFNLRLAPGSHTYVLRHRCCAEATKEIVVTSARPDQVYKLQYGVPKPARLVVLNAPPDARVLIDGAMVGTAPELPPYLMTDPDKSVTVTIGDRTLQTKLKAGDDNRIDYAGAEP